MHRILLSLAVLAAPLLLLLLLVHGYAYLHVARHAAAAASSNLREATGDTAQQTYKSGRWQLLDRRSNHAAQMTSHKQQHMQPNALHARSTDWHKDSSRP
jgi:hypothetical protein